MDTNYTIETLKSIDTRIREVAEILGYECDYYNIDTKCGEIDLFWEHSPQCGCCSAEYGVESFSIEYLSMSDDEIRQTVEGKKAEAERRRKEREREAAERKARIEAQKKLARAQERVRKAERAIRTAEFDAKRELAQAQAELDKLQEQAA